MVTTFPAEFAQQAAVATVNKASPTVAPTVATVAPTVAVAATIAAVAAGAWTKAGVRTVEHSPVRHTAVATTLQTFAARRAATVTAVAFASPFAATLSTESGYVGTEPTRQRGSDTYTDLWGLGDFLGYVSF